MPVLETERLVIREFTPEDLPDLHRILDARLAQAPPAQRAQTLTERESWLRWTIAGYAENEKLLNPPYGDRAIVLRDGARLVGACGLVPCYAPFGLLPSLAGVNEIDTDPRAALNRPEVGIYYAVAPEHRRRGYATEAALALIRFALGELRAARVVATTTRDNAASIAVMRRAGMRVEENPHAQPPWLQVVGVKE
jgi:ribosomal-protein-alanine N-acetyltransferase